jgi:hypothetical protein
MRVFKNRLLRRCLDLSRRKQWEAGENYIMSNFIICINHAVTLG